MPKCDFNQVAYLLQKQPPGGVPANIRLDEDVLKTS